MIENMEDAFLSTDTEKKDIVKENFFVWNEKLKTGDPKLVAELYAEDATFLPTVSGKFKQGKIEVEEYFKHFLEKNPVGEIVEEEVQVLGDGSYLHSGMYNFMVGPNNLKHIIEARFTFVWKQDDKGEWKIIHHHSSEKPKE